MIGNVHDRLLHALNTIERVASPLKVVIRPIKQRFFPHSKKHHLANTQTQDPSDAEDSSDSEDSADAVDAVAPISIPTPVPTPSDYVYQQLIRKNMAFDHWRSAGIRNIYEGQTEEAIACFKKALAIRPDSDYIKTWIFVSENPIPKLEGGGNVPQIPQAPNAQGLPNLPGQ
jgi:tetratricopeptide (TPR) repeat protein